MMDPWLTSSSDEQSSMKFEDDFEPDNRLPDSVEYLAALEKKLAKLKEKQSGKDLVQSLDETHKSCMTRLVTDGVAQPSDDDFILDRPLGAANVLARRIAPERQALTFGEMVELLKADQLSEKLADDTDKPETVESQEKSL